MSIIQWECIMTAAANQRYGAFIDNKLYHFSRVVPDYIRCCCLAFLLVIPASIFAQSKNNPVAITVDAVQVRWQISRYLLGMHFVYPQERDAIYADGRIADWARKQNIAIARFPGGTVVDYWDWEHPTGIHRGDRWEPGYDSTNDVPATEWMSLDEYMAFCRRAGAEPLVGVNILGGWQYDRVEDSISRAVRCVKYCKRKGYNVRWWYLGNEIEGKLGIENYAKLVKRHADAMKQVDPTIKTMPNTNVMTPEKVRTFLEICGSSIDGVEFHGKWKGFRAVGRYQDWLRESPLQHAEERGIYSEKIWRFRDVAKEMGYPDLIMANNEWGLGGRMEGFNKYTKSLVMVEYLQDMFMGNYDMACLWNTHWRRNSDNHLLDSTNGYAFNPVARGFELLSTAAEQQMLALATTNRFVYGFACRDAAGVAVQIYLLNKTESEQNVSITVQFFRPDPAQAPVGHVMQHPGTGLKTLQVLLVKSTGAVTATLPSLSYTRLTINGRLQ